MKLMLCLLLAALVQPVLAAMSHGRALGTTAAFDQQQRLWIVRSEPVDENAHVVLERSDDNGKTWQPAIRVTTQPEPVSADGENRHRSRMDGREAARVPIYGRRLANCDFWSAHRQGIGGIVNWVLARRT